jgi:spermidine/putrescine transport system ATP-binding protein
MKDSMSLEVENIWKSYEKQPLLRGLSFSVARGETVCLLGRSGSGKSTLLRIIAGLEKSEQGMVKWEGQDLAEVPVHKRGFGLMFQDYALFPHRNVAENVAFGLRMKRLPEEDVKKRVEKVLEQVNLTAFAKRRVTDLSGGEQQRVALARALAPDPHLLMLDEPLGALDRSLREQLILELRGLLHSSGIPAIYVTHDQEEAFALGDRLILLHEGIIEQSGTPEDLMRKPTSAWAAAFFGMGNLVRGKVINQNPFQVQTQFGVFRLATPGYGVSQDENVTLLLRPSAGEVLQFEGINKIDGTIVDVVFRGDGYLTTLDAGKGEKLTFFLSERFEAGTSLALFVKPEEILCLDH